ADYERLAIGPTRSTRRDFWHTHAALPPVKCPSTMRGLDRWPLTCRSRGGRSRAAGSAVCRTMRAEVSRFDCGMTSRKQLRVVALVSVQLVALVYGMPSAMTAELSSDVPPQRVIRVGTERELKRPSAAAQLARDGDLVEIDAGVYDGDAAV